MKPRITERGWGGHFICARDCLFRRNTLIEHGRRRIVVSTVGNYRQRADGKIDSIGHERHYETMAFLAHKEGGYWEADVSKQLSFESEWAIEGVTQMSDQRANDMHDAVVAEFVKRECK